MDKQELRRQIAAAIRTMSDAERIAQSTAVVKQILYSEVWQQAHTVLLYCALPDEVSLRQLIEHAIAEQKQVILPVVNGETLLLRQYDPKHMAIQGRFQIEEPTAEAPLFTQTSALDLAIIPGRGFTATGARMGRGKGFYDRLLPQLKCPKWGVAFDCQILEELPTDPWDVPMDRVIAP